MKADSVVDKTKAFKSFRFVQTIKNAGAKVGYFIRALQLWTSWCCGRSNIKEVFDLLTFVDLLNQMTNRSKQDCQINKNPIKPFSLENWKRYLPWFVIIDQLQ